MEEPLFESAPYRRRSPAASDRSLLLALLRWSLDQGAAGRRLRRLVLFLITENLSGIARRLLAGLLVRHCGHPFCW